MAAARGELPNFNLLAAFGLEEFRNEIDAMNAEKNEARGEQSNVEQSNKKRRFAETEKHDLDDIVTNSQAKRNTMGSLSFYRSVETVQVYFNSQFQKISLVCTRESKRGVNRYY